MKDKVKILVVENDIHHKQTILTALEQLDNADCVGTASTSELALRKIHVLQPDVVLLDVQLPQGDTLSIIDQLKRHCPRVESIIVSHLPHDALGNESQRLLHLASLAPVIMPIEAQHSEQLALHCLMNALQPLLQHLQQCVTPTPILTNLPVKIQPPPVLQPIKTVLRGCELCVVGVSTGGPKALEYLVQQLGASIQCPIIIVQHMPPLFTHSLAGKLNTQTRLTVSEVIDGELLCNGHIYIAPGGYHLLLAKQVSGTLYFSVTKAAPVNNCRPSVDVLFTSVASVFKGKVLAVIMTGMGRDGTEGVRLLKQQGARCIIQDKVSSVVWGMPGSVYSAGLADEVVSLEQLGARMTALLI